MKVLTAAQMREVDRQSIEAGIPGIVLMENAGHRVAEFIVEKFSPLDQHRIVMLPYTHIDNVAFGVMLPDAEVQAIFGGNKAGATAEPSLAPSEAVAAEGAPDAESDAETAAANDGVSSDAPTPPADGAPAPGAAAPEPALKPSKSVLLARLRARLGGQPSRAP